MKKLLSIILLFVSYNVIAQLPANTFRSRIFTGNTEAQWMILDSPLVNFVGTSLFNARYPGTQLVKIGGGDTAFYFGAGGNLWFRSLLDRDTISLSNRINTKLNITDTTGKWWGVGKRWVDTVYRVNDSTVGFTINNGTQQTFQILGRSSGGGGGGSGTVTSVGLSMPAAFSVTNSPITTSGTIAVSGAGTTAQYIRGNGTLATTDTSMIPNYYLKVRGLLSGTSPITFNQTTGIIGALRANNTGQLGVATFNNSDFIDNGAGLISLRSASGGGGVDTIYRTQGIDSIYFVIGSDTSAILDSTGQVITANNGLTKTGANIQLGGALIQPTTISSAAGANRIIYSGVSASGDGAQLDVTTTGSVGTAVKGTTTDGRGLFGVATTGVGVYGTATGSGGIGLFGLTTDGSAIYSQSTTGKVFEGINMPATTNSVESVGSFTRSSSVTGANGIGGSIDFNLRTTTADQLSNQIIWKYTDATNASRTSALEFWSLNNATLARKANLAGSGQWTWDGYPSLTAQVDTTTYKPIAIDASGNVVKMIGWSSGAGGGGSPSLAYKNVGFGGVGGILSPGESSFQYDSIINELTVDSTSAIQHRADYITLNAIEVIDTVRAFGNSITVGLNASPQTDSGYIYRIGKSLGKPVGNYAISGTGAVTAISQHFRYTPIPNGAMTSVMVGFNDIRRNNILGTTGFKTLNKIINAHKSIFVNHFMKSYVQSGCTSCGVTRYGAWTASWDATLEAGKSTNAAYTSTVNDSIVYAFTDSTICIGLIGQTSSFQAGSAFSVYVDGVLKQTGTTDNQTDGIGDGFSNNDNRAPMAMIITGLSYAAHSVKVVNNGSGVFIVDYFSHLREAASAPPLLVLNIPYMDSTGYSTSPSNSSDIKTDTMNNKVDSLVNSFPAAYRLKTYLVRTNTCYDTLTGLSTDHIHPNNTGHGQFATCAIATISNDSKPLGSLYYSNDALYFVNSAGPKKLVWGNGSSNHVSRFLDANTIIDGTIQDDGTNVGIAQTPATYKLSVTGSLRSTADAYFATASGSVGIGTIVPNYKLDVNGHAGVHGSLFTYGSLAGVSIDSRQSSTAAWSLYANDDGLNIYSIANTLSRARYWARGGLTIFYNTESAGTDESRGLAVHGSVAIEKDSVPIVTSPSGPYYVLIQDTSATTDSNRVKRILPSNLGTATTIYSGDGTLSGNRTVTGGGNSLTFSGANLFRVYSNYFYQAKSDGSRAYASAIDPGSTGRQSWQFGYSPFTRGVGLYVDTLNNVGLGDNTITTMPLYATGNSAYVRNGFQSQQGNFYGITNVSSTSTLGLTDNFCVIDASGGNITITLPAASAAFAGNMGLDLVFKRIDNSGNTVTIQRAGSDQIDGANSFTLPAQYDSKKIRAISTSAWAIY